jgi:CHAT domain-containing protein
VRLLTDGEATVSAIIEALPTCGLLHLAAHAVYRPDSPQFSWAQLADGPLAVADLAELRLEQQPLVVLSACESGRGQPRGGGLVGMARGFMLAGAAGLIASLWKVADGATAGFMADLYAQLQSHSPADALAAAQRRAIARGEHPFHWAAFVCIEA